MVISLYVNIIAWLELKLTNYDVGEQYVNHDDHQTCQIIPNIYVQ